MDINLDAFRHIDFKESGTFVVKYSPNLEYGGLALQPNTTKPNEVLAEIEYYLGDQNKERPI